MKVKHVLVFQWLFLNQYLEVIFALFHLVSLLFYHDQEIEHVKFIDVDIGVEDSLVRVVDDG